MAWTGAFRKGAKGGIIWDQTGSRQIEFINEDFVQPKVRGEHEFVVGIHVDAMGVRSLLPLWINARSLVLDKGCNLTERAIGGDRVGRNAPAAIIGHQGDLA